MTGRTTTPEFYIAGGTLSPTAECYLVRQADRDLLVGLLAGDMCYVLTSRQMGKSSLMIRTAAAIRERGGHCLVIELTSLGNNVTPEQWYLGMLCQMAGSIAQYDEVVDTWCDYSYLPPVQRYKETLRCILSAWPAGPVVIFLDEIDAVRSLPFSSDEFFAAIREILNSRAVSDDFSRLTFCLIGVALPSDLIRDARATPFNVGRRIVLTDFTVEDMLPLSAGMPNLNPRLAERVFKRIHYWTGGQPYLSLRLCKELADRNEQVLPPLVDRLASDLFLSQSKRESDPNLSFTQQRVLNLNTDITRLLRAYLHAWRGYRFAYYPSDPLAEMLLLGGLVRVKNNRLVPRNRVYRRVFDAAWVYSNLPAAEVKRQKAEYRRGIFLGGTSVAALGAVFLILVLINVISRQRMLAAETKTADYADNAYRLAYDAQFQLIQGRMDEITRARANAVLQDTLPAPGQADLRRFEWFFLHRIADQQQSTFQALSEQIHTLRYAPDGQTYAAICGSELRIFNTRSNSLVYAATAKQRDIFFSGDYSPNSHYLVTPGDSSRLQIWDLIKKRRAEAIGPPRGSDGLWRSVAFSPDGKQVLCGGEDGYIERWNRAGYRVARYPKTGRVAGRGIWSIAISPDKRQVAAGCDDGTLKIWDFETAAEIASIPAHIGYIYSIAYSPDGHQLLTGGCDGTTRFFDATTRKLLRTWFYHSSYVYSVAFSHNGQQVASAGWDHSAMIWDVHNDLPIQTFHTQHPIWSIAFSPDDRHIAIGDSMGGLRIASPSSANVVQRLAGLESKPIKLQVSSAGTTVAAMDQDGNLRTWSTETGKTLFAKSIDPAMSDAAISGDGSWMAIVTPHGWQMRECATGRLFLSFPHNLKPGVLVSLNHDGSRMAFVNDDRCHYVNAWTGQTIATYPVPKGLSILKIRADGLRVAYCGPGIPPTLVSAGTGRRVFALQGKPSTMGVHRLDFSSDGSQFIVSAGIVTVWDTGDGEFIRKFVDQYTPLSAAIVQSDGTRVFTAGLDRSLKLWDTLSGRVLMEFQTSGARTDQLSLSKDGRVLASGYDNGMIWVWDTRYPGPQNSVAATAPEVEEIPMPQR